MTFDRNGAHTRSGTASTDARTTPKRTDADKAAKLYGETAAPAPASSRHAATGPRTMGLGGLIERAGTDQGARIRIDATPISDGTTRLHVTIPVKPPAAYQRYKVDRDRDRPLEFDGLVLALVEEPSFGDQVLLRAAIYQTKGNKFVSSITRFEVEPGVDYGDGKPPYLFAKAEVFDSRDIAAMWFRTKGGRLTQELMRQLGGVDSEFIE
jgi:hypothetical protein